MILEKQTSAPKIDWLIHITNSRGKINSQNHHHSTTDCNACLSDIHLLRKSSVGQEETWTGAQGSPVTWPPHTDDQQAVCLTSVLVYSVSSVTLSTFPQTLGQRRSALKSKQPIRDPMFPAWPRQRTSPSTGNGHQLPNLFFNSSCPTSAKALPCKSKILQLLSQFKNCKTLLSQNTLF